MVSAERHREISAQFLIHAEDEFQKGDLLQASEKAWGAVSHYVNSVARERGWPLGSHRRLIENANRLFDKDPSSARYGRRLLRSIEALHGNFYQEFLDMDSVRDGIDDARELIEKFEELNKD